MKPHPVGVLKVIFNGVKLMSPRPRHTKTPTPLRTKASILMSYACSH